MEYPYCKTLSRGNTFRYQDVACCPEHGTIYFNMIMESRGMSCNDNAANNSGEAVEEANKACDSRELFRIVDYEDDDYFFDEDDEDDDEEDIDIQ